MSRSCTDLSVLAGTKCRRFVQVEDFPKSTAGKIETPRRRPSHGALDLMTSDARRWVGVGRGATDQQRRPRGLELQGIRRYTDSPVDDDAVRTVIWGGTRASGRNNTKCVTVVVRDADRRQEVADSLRHFASGSIDCRNRRRARGQDSRQAALPGLMEDSPRCRC
ncbi:MAG: hypothetical protein R2715_08095 [Ilumatobacteraceae bacterium]